MGSDRELIADIFETREQSWVSVVASDIIEGCHWQGLDFFGEDGQWAGRVKVEEGDPGDVRYIPVDASGQDSLRDFQSLREARAWVEALYVDWAMTEPDIERETF